MYTPNGQIAVVMAATDRASLVTDDPPLGGGAEQRADAMPDERSRETSSDFSMFPANLQPGDANYTKVIVQRSWGPDAADRLVAGYGRRHGPWVAS